MPGRQNNKHPARPYHKRIQQPNGKITPVELASVYLCDFPVLTGTSIWKWLEGSFADLYFVCLRVFGLRYDAKSTPFYFLFKQQKEAIFIVFISNGKTKVYINVKN